MGSAAGSETFVVVNPTAAAGRAGRRFPEVAEQLRVHLGAFSHAFTEAPGDGARLARAALEGGARLIIAVGGDGTAGEVAGAFFEEGRALFPEATLGLIPFGTGGDLRRSLELPSGPKAVAALAQGKTRAIDVGWARYTTDAGPAERAFLNVASLGASGAVVQEVRQGSKRLGGRAAFFLGSAKALWRYRDLKVQMTFDDHPPQEAALTTLAVCNGRYFGGGMKVAPKASLDDGRFDLTLWQGYGLADFFVKAPAIYGGTHLEDPRTHALRAKRVAVESEEEVLIEVDGEGGGRLPASFEILPGALKVRVG